jgi:hypothetical protein
VNLSTMRVLGMKSYDFHIWIERILPAMVRGYVPEHVWLALSELSYFFHQLCAKELSRNVVADLERLAPVLLCKLEKIFPPGFFNPMQHLILHLPYEARMGGPVQGRWCYPIERCLKTIRKKCRNKCKIEASCWSEGRNTTLRSKSPLHSRRSDRDKAGRDTLRLIGTRRRPATKASHSAASSSSEAHVRSGPL